MQSKSKLSKKEVILKVKASVSAGNYYYSTHADLRVPVAFDGNMVVITTINIDSDNER
jgi:hypothetical protein